MSKLGPISHFLSPVSCDSLVLQGFRCVWGSRCVKFDVIALTLSYWSLEVQHGTSWQRTLWGSEKKRIVALHKDGVGYKNIAKTLKLSCSTVAKTIQRFNRTGSTQNRPCHGQPKKLKLRDVVMEEWKRTPVATCEALVNSMPKRVKAVMENNGGHTKYWHFGPNLDIFT